MLRIAVLASTNGTDLQAIIDEIVAGRLNVELTCVVSNKKKCYALERAQQQGYKTYFIDPKGKTREEFDAQMVALLQTERVDLVVLVGYMKILTPLFVRAFPQRIINVHPALIPKYSGKDFFGASVHEAVLKSGDAETGMTIHYVDEGVDSGEIIMQKKCPVLPGDTVETLKARVQALEKEWYPKAIAQIANASATS
ncbi:phosphoribosylglycinamide formyltransferase [Candidatus Gracilibacteria bacterium]|nr:phosphoribosylglycinamide formyltransferase [Candidatus Gracilibacteria bacterium]